MIFGDLRKSDQKLIRIWFFISADFGHLCISLFQALKGMIRMVYFKDFI